MPDCDCKHFDMFEDGDMTCDAFGGERWLVGMECASCPLNTANKKTCKGEKDVK